MITNQIDGSSDVLDTPELYGERWRPLLHFTPAQNWMNDPNGLVFYAGLFHLYYQHNPGANVWGDIHWGHAVSRDLVHWQHKDLAIYPDYDGLGIVASGSAVVDWHNTSGLAENGEAVLVALFSHFSKQDKQVQSLAYSLDKGDTWISYPDNPVIDNPGIADFRDPKVFWHEPAQHWVMVLAAGDHIKLYTSNNLLDWVWQQDFVQSLGIKDGVWECPDLFPLQVQNDQSVKWVMLISVQNGAPAGGSGTYYFIGDFDGHHFHYDASKPQRAHWLDYGPDNYAGVSWSDAQQGTDRRLLIGWMSNWRYADKTPTSTWRGAMTLPRELTLHQHQDGLRLHNQPVNALTALRRQSHYIQPQVVFGQLDLSAIVNMQRQLLELQITFVCPTSQSTSFGLEFFNQHGECLRVLYLVASRQLVIDRTEAVGAALCDSMVSSFYASLPQSEPKLRWQLFLDQSSVELFANEGLVSMSAQIFPKYPLLYVRFFSDDGCVELDSAHAYQLNSIWSDAGQCDD